MKKIFLLIFFVLVTFFASCGDASYDKEFRENRNDIEKENEESPKESLGVKLPQFCQIKLMRNLMKFLKMKFLRI